MIRNLGLAARGFYDAPSQVNALGGFTPCRVVIAITQGALGKTTRNAGHGRWARVALITIVAFFATMTPAEAIDQSLVTCEQVRLFAARHNIYFDSRLNRIKARAVALSEGLVLTQANIRAAAKCFEQSSQLKETAP
jgi:hypothetical protein